MNIAWLAVWSMHTGNYDWPKQRDCLRMTSTSPQMFKKCLELDCLANQSLQSFQGFFKGKAYLNDMYMLDFSR